MLHSRVHGALPPRSVGPKPARATTRTTAAVHVRWCVQPDSRRLVQLPRRGMRCLGGGGEPGGCTAPRGEIHERRQLLESQVEVLLASVPQPRWQQAPPRQRVLHEARRTHGGLRQLQRGQRRPTSLRPGMRFAARRVLQRDVLHRGLRRTLRRGAAHQDPMALLRAIEHEHRRPAVRGGPPLVRRA